MRPHFSHPLNCSTSLINWRRFMAQRRLSLRAISMHRCWRCIIACAFVPRSVCRLRADAFDGMRHLRVHTGVGYVGHDFLRHVRSVRLLFLLLFLRALLLVLLPVLLLLFLLLRLRLSVRLILRLLVRLLLVLLSLLLFLLLLLVPLMLRPTLSRALLFSQPCLRRHGPRRRSHISPLSNFTLLPLHAGNILAPCCTRHLGGHLGVNVMPGAQSLALGATRMLPHPAPPVLRDFLQPHRHVATPPCLCVWSCCLLSFFNRPSTSDPIKHGRGLPLVLNLRTSLLCRHPSRWGR